MKGRALPIWIGLVGIAGFALFNTVFSFEQLEGDMSRLNKEILKEQNAVHVLRAEWSYLNRPDRIEALVRKLLPRLGAPAATKIGALDWFEAPPRSASITGVKGAIRPALIGGKP